MIKPVIIIGAGGHAKVIADILHCQGRPLLGVLDDSGVPNNSFLSKLGGIESVAQWIEKAEFIVGVGSNLSRSDIVSRLPFDVKYATAIHPSAIIADDVIIEEGTVIMPGAIINTGSKVGKHCIINTAASIDHDCFLEDFVHISPGAHLAGTVKIGSHSWIGAGGIVVNNRSICVNCIIGAGGVVIKDIVESGTYAGVPVKRLHADLNSEKLK